MAPNGNVAGSIGPLPICFLWYQLLVAGGSAFIARPLFTTLTLISRLREQPPACRQRQRRTRRPATRRRGTKASNEIFQRNARLNGPSLRLKSDDGLRKNRITALPIGQCGASFSCGPTPRFDWPFLFHSTRVIAQIRCWWSSSSCSCAPLATPPPDQRWRVNWQQ